MTDNRDSDNDNNISPPGTWRVKNSRKNKNPSASTSSNKKIKTSKNNCLDSFFSNAADVQKLMSDGENTASNVTTLSRVLTKGDKFRIINFYQRGIQDSLLGFKKVWVLTILSMKNLSEEIDVYCPAWLILGYLESWVYNGFTEQKSSNGGDKTYKFYLIERSVDN